jgi:hypothetical protein
MIEHEDDPRANSQPDYSKAQQAPPEVRAWHFEELGNTWKPKNEKESG